MSLLVYKHGRRPRAGQHMRRHRKRCKRKQGLFYRRKTHRHVPWLDPCSSISSVSWSLPLPDTPPLSIPPSLITSPSLHLSPFRPPAPSLLHYTALKVNVCFHLSGSFSTSTCVSSCIYLHLSLLVKCFFLFSPSSGNCLALGFFSLSPRKSPSCVEVLRWCSEQEIREVGVRMM